MRNSRKKIVMVTMEIHNHFETGSSAQVFNDRVTTNNLSKKRKWKRGKQTNKNM